VSPGIGARFRFYSVRSNSRARPDTRRPGPRRCVPGAGHRAVPGWATTWPAPSGWPWEPR